MKELRLPRKENPTEEVVDERGAPATRVLKILHIERSEVRDDAKMLGMIEHHLQQGAEGVRKPATKSRRNSKDLRGFQVAPGSPHFKSFVQIYAEHRVRSFQATKAMRVSIGLVADKRLAPVLRDRSGVLQ